MRTFRTSAFMKITVSVLVFGLGLTLFSRNSRADDRPFDYSFWLSLHLPGSIPESVQKALEVADQSGAGNLEAYLEAFLDEINRSGSEREASEWLYGELVAGTVLQNDLRLRLIDVVSSSILNRGFVVSSLRVAQATKELPETQYRTNLQAESRLKLSFSGLSFSDLVRTPSGSVTRSTSRPRAP
jgi:hypothetical protein